MEHKFFLNDGTVLSNNRDTVEYLASLGFDHLELLSAVSEYAGDSVEDELGSARDKADEYETLYDGLYCDTRNLINVINRLADALDSGKTGKGNTKRDIAEKLRKATMELECI